MNRNSTSRRKALGALTGIAGLSLTSSLSSRLSAADKVMPQNLKGSVNHSVCRWCYRDVELDDLAKAAVEIGLSSIELLKIEEFKKVQKYDLSCAMVSPSGSNYSIGNGWNKKENHAGMTELYMREIDEAAKVGLKNIIVFSGNRETNLSDEEGLENCAEGLKKVMAYAEKKRVTLVMELLNSKVNHPDYMCDHTSWGVDLCQKLDSDNFKLLYDIYHMQIMEGDVIRTIKDNHKYIAHYHTGGVPGRNEIDETQELNYPAIIKAILDTGYKGFVGQEFIPKRDNKLASLKQGVTICDI
ncbi:hydroxypyruvate isomerase family protein [Arcticibacterium luteifluviistationis]|uniref:Hydroxypyruvate isomerase n=1 Tax=Arcticibacterium luteifluviistationis TaxID=1784714 RepID=A0A2Z4GAN6_9BACT|nr:TIM barrel protein [Arcticibacterium luteifluviistationis]AWV98138.1 hydroxypyruvate isomerase [Arcticibacterium luteifluviistationis]